MTTWASVLTDADKKAVRDKVRAMPALTDEQLDELADYLVESSLRGGPGSVKT